MTDATRPAWLSPRTLRWALIVSLALNVLIIGVEKATQLTNFVLFPMTAPQTTINGEGKLEFRFSPPDNAAFFRLEAR